MVTTRTPAAFGLKIAIAALSVIATSRVEAQDFPDTQRISGAVLFKRQQISDQQRQAERRRVDDLDKQSQQQAVLLQEQSATVKRLSGELQTLRDEREITKTADAFDVAFSTGRWTDLTQLLADDVTLNLPGTRFAPGVIETPQGLVAAFAGSPASRNRQPRANQQVELRENNATLTYMGIDWLRPSKEKTVTGIFEYRFRRSPDGWKLDGLSYKPAAF